MSVVHRIPGSKPSTAVRRPRGPLAWNMRLAVIAALLLAPFGADAQDAGAPLSAAEGRDGRAQSFRHLFVDEEDGALDVSNLLARGGFIPVPVIITEPAVDGGLGFVAQFLSWPDQNKDTLTRRMIGGVKTRNGSYGYGFFQSGTALDGRLAYKFGVGRGKVSLDTYPFGGSVPVSYTSDYDYGILASALWDLPDDRFSVGPLLDFRSITTSLEVPGSLGGLVPDLERRLKTGALGLGFHFDDRDNPLSPTKGLNAYIDAKFNEGAFGSDRDFRAYDLAAYYFLPLGEVWDLGIKGTLNLAEGDTPFIFMPSVDNRGIPYNRYQGEQVLSTEIQLSRQVAPRWDVVAFAGYGATRAGDSRLFDDTDGVWSGGAGFRYLIARKFGLKAGMDLAVGPEDTVVYFQFGHAWSMGMD